MRISDGSGDTLIVHTASMLQTGKDILANAVNLGGDLAQNMKHFHDQFSSSSTPKCLQTILEPYAYTRKRELDKMVKRRQTIGDLLTKASTMHQVNEEMQKNGFANLYQNVQNFYASSADATNPTNMQRGRSTSNK